MTDSNSDLRALAEAATPGPWVTDAKCKLGSVYCDDSLGSAVAECALQWTVAISERQDVRNAEYIAAANPARILALLDERDAIATDRDRMVTLWNLECQSAEGDRRAATAAEAALARLQEENRRLREQVAANTPEIGRVIGHVVWHALGHVHTGRVYGNAEDADRVRQATACHVRERLTVKPVVLARSSSKETQ